MRKNREKNGFARRRGERIGFHMKKKWLAAAAAVLCAATMASCGQGVVDLTSSGQESASSAPVSSALSEEEVEDTLEGLEQYMASLGYISGTPSTMRGDMIGAKEEGHRYATAAATVEFYEYDLSNLNDTAKAVRESVEADGTFDMIGQTVQGAVLSDSGKYLMIYTATAPTRKPPPRRKRRSPRSVPSRPNNAEPEPKHDGPADPCGIGRPVFSFSCGGSASLPPLPPSFPQLAGFHPCTAELWKSKHHGEGTDRIAARIVEKGRIETFHKIEVFNS